MSDWLFVRQFNDKDLQEFLREFGESVRTIAAGGEVDVDHVLHAWRMTAEVLADPVAREILAGDSADWVEVGEDS